ncbi:hypothetical protein ACQJ79_07580 [Helicobacter pylori]
MIATQQAPIIDSDTIMGYVFENKVKPSDDWFNTPFKSSILKPLLTDKRGMIDRRDLSKLYFDFKSINTQFGKRYTHTKMNSRKVKMVSLIDNNKLKVLYFTWLRSKGLKWDDIDHALKDLMSLCAIASIEKQGSNNE